MALSSTESLLTRISSHESASDRFLHGLESGLLARARLSPVKKKEKPYAGHGSSMLALAQRSRNDRCVAWTNVVLTIIRIWTVAWFDAAGVPAC